MSNKKNKLESIKTVSKAKEKELYSRLTKVKKINREREEILKDLKGEKIIIEKDILKMENFDKKQYLIKGQISQVVNLSQEVKQKKNLLKIKLEQIEEANKNYLLSKERLEALESEILENKIDQKKYESIIEGSKLKDKRLSKEIEDINLEDIYKK